MKRIMTIQDISCVGKCSLTVALPVISAAGIETSVLPTAVLSTHTAFPSFTFKDLTDEIEPIGDTLKKLDMDFDALYTGYLGSFRQIKLVEDFIDKFKTKDNFVLVDPAMADNGKLYSGFDEEFAHRMALLCSKSDLIIPNLTEASFMLHIPYKEDYDEEYIKELLVKLTQLGAKSAAISGVSFNDKEIGFYLYNSETKEFSSYFNQRLPVLYHGTGDVFASATLAGYMNGLSVHESLVLATDFTLEAMKYTLRDQNRRFYGVNFEEAIPFLIEKINFLKNA